MKSGVPGNGARKLCLMASRPSLVTPSGRFEMQCSGSFPLAKIPRIESPETPRFNKKVSTASGATSDRPDLHTNTNNFAPNEYREVVNPSGLVVYKGSNTRDNSDRYNCN